MFGRRLKIAWLSLHDLMQLLNPESFFMGAGFLEVTHIEGLPEDARVTAVTYSFERDMLGLRIWSETFDEIPACDPFPWITQEGVVRLGCKSVSVNETEERLRDKISSGKGRESTFRALLEDVVCLGGRFDGEWLERAFAAIAESREACELKAREAPKVGSAWEGTPKEGA